jgi:glycerophosphoryl diester phosphodiesterase
LKKVFRFGVLFILALFGLSLTINGGCVSKEIEPPIIEEPIVEEVVSDNISDIVVEETIVEEVVLPESIDYSYILHAGGITPNGDIGSNSIEATENSYNKGYRVIEIDFCWTLDGKLACVHDWGGYYGRMYGNRPLTSEEFEEARNSTYGFTSFTLDHLCEWLKEHKDVVIVTDIKENCVKGARMIAEKYPELKDNFCIQMYDKSEYEELSNLGFNKIIWTLYQLSWNEKTDTKSIVSFAKTHKLEGITFAAELVDLVPNYVKKLKEANVPLFVHTVNDYNSQTKYLNMGITGIYTDFGEAKMVDDWKVK